MMLMSLLALRRFAGGLRLSALSARERPLRGTKGTAGTGHRPAGTASTNHGVGVCLTFAAHADVRLETLFKAAGQRLLARESMPIIRWPGDTRIANTSASASPSATRPTGRPIRARALRLVQLYG